MRWYAALVAAAIVGAVLYAGGLPYPVVYVIRSIVRHLVGSH
jgi:hypothetical protein